MAMLLQDALPLPDDDAVCRTSLASTHGEYQLALLGQE
jgi:hypothetical protein